MVLSDPGISGLKRGACVDEYDYQNKDKTHYHYEKLFSVQCIKAKTCDSPLCYCCHLGRHLEYFTSLKKNSNMPVKFFKYDGS